MLTTLPGRVSALLADPFHAPTRQMNRDFCAEEAEADASRDLGIRRVSTQ